MIKLRSRQKGFLFAPLLVILTALLFSSNLFSIKNIDVNGQNIDCSDTEELKKLSDLYGKNLFLVDTTEEEKTLKEKFLCIRSINFFRNYPSSIRMDISGRDPKLQLILVKEKEASLSSLINEFATPSAEEILDSYIVDDEGIVFSKDSKAADIPKAFLLKQDLSLSQKIDTALLNSLKILEALRMLGVASINTIIFDRYLITNDNPKIVFKLNEDIETQIASLQLILQKAKIDNESLEFIDLRFDKPVIKMAPKK